MASNRKTADGARNKKAVKSILISQPAPKTDKNPYSDIAEKWGIQVDFRKFIEVVPVTPKEFRKQRVNLLDYTAIIFLSQTSIRHYFELCKEMRVEMPQETKYFCSSETTALYLQRFIEYRKRKVFFPKDNKHTLRSLLEKHKAKAKFLYPCANNRKDKIPDFLNEKEFDWTEATTHNVLCSDLSDLENIFYDMIVFFTPLGVKSLFENFPDFKQKDTRLAAWGTVTHQTLENHDLELDVSAPSPEFKSMTMAIESYLRVANEEK